MIGEDEEKRISWLGAGGSSGAVLCQDGECEGQGATVKGTYQVVNVKFFAMCGGLVVTPKLAISQSQHGAYWGGNPQG